MTFLLNVKLCSFYRIRNLCCLYRDVTTLLHNILSAIIKPCQRYWDWFITTHIERTMNITCTCMTKHDSLIDWQQVRINSLRPLPCLVGGALPGGRNICIDH